jgi:RNA polymerase sigma factor (sigma-70 family)
MNGFQVLIRIYIEMDVRWLGYSLGTGDAVEIAVEKYADMVRRICFLNLRNHTDLEDVFQEVFLQLFLNSNSFQSEQHEKAWLCKVTFNKCKDLNKSFWRKRIVSIENLEIPYESKEQSDVFNALLKLSKSDKEVIYLHFYEGFTIPEIAEIAQQNINTTYTRLRRAKEKLKLKMEEIK